MNPLCETVSCCEACVAPFESLVQCIVNQVVDYLPTDCGLKCEAEPVRLRRRKLVVDRKDRNRRKKARRRQRKRATLRVRKCVLGFATKPVSAAALDGGDPAGSFFDCLTSGYLKFFNKK